MADRLNRVRILLSIAAPLHRRPPKTKSLIFTSSKLTQSTMYSVWMFGRVKPEPSEIGNLNSHTQINWKRKRPLGRLQKEGKGRPLFLFRWSRPLIQRPAETCQDPLWFSIHRLSPLSTAADTHDPSNQKIFHVIKWPKNSCVPGASVLLHPPGRQGALCELGGGEVPGEAAFAPAASPRQWSSVRNFNHFLSHFHPQIHNHPNHQIRNYSQGIKLFMEEKKSISS